MTDRRRHEQSLGFAVLTSLLVGCTERTDLAPVHIGHQNIHALIPAYTYPPPVTQGHVPANAPQLSASLPPPATAAALPQPNTPEPPAPVIKEKQPLKETAVKPPAVEASHPPGKKSIMVKAIPATPSPQAPASVSQQTTPAASKSKLNFAWPLAGRITKNYRQTGKKGIRIAAGKEHTVRAAESGQVVYSGRGLIGYGNLLIIKHNNQYLTAYANNSSLLAKEGDIVNKGQSIATVGNGRSDKGLLHFEIRKYGKAVNPLALLPKL